MSSQVQSLQKQITQLRMEANVNRISVNQAIEEIMNYTRTNNEQDFLVIGVNPSVNPFRDQKSCNIL